eukprot:3310835-Pyramimonas_sp.AAC.1
MAAGQNYGGQVKEKGKGRKMGPPGLHAGMVLIGGIQDLVPDWQKSGKAAVPASIDRAMDTRATS